MKQLEMLRKENSAYGGELFKTRQGRARPRPLSTRETLHLVLRSSRAKNEWSFARKGNRKKIHEILTRFSRKYGVKVLSYANVGNHLHLHIKLSNRYHYQPFIRALTGAIAMAITGSSRWKPLKRKAKDRFWDYRPYTRIVRSFRALLNLKDYIRINQYEGFGYSRREARFFVASDAVLRLDTS
jgi:REP element-mobilizing transposase RayT